jgi:SAM-dependent methyltransferase
MNKLRLKRLYKKHLILSVGNKPSRQELSETDEIMRKVNSILDSNSDIQKLYDKKLAKIWPRIVANEPLSDELIILNKFVKIKTNSNITSIASGLGVFEMFLARYFCPKGEIYCIDFSKEMNKKGREISKKMKLKNITFFTASATKLPVRENSQNVVLARRTGLSMKGIWTRVLKEVDRVLIKDEQSRFVYTVQANLLPSKNKIRTSLKKRKLHFISMQAFKESDGTKIALVIAKPLL